MSEVKHEILGGEVYVYKRENSGFWQCSTFLAGKNRRISTKEESLARATDFAEDWYLELKGKYRRGGVADGKTFKEVSERFLREYEIITEGTRNPIYVEGHRIRLRAHLLPFFGDMSVRQINAGHLQDYRIHRREKAMAAHGKGPARNTIHQEIVTLRGRWPSSTRGGAPSRLNGHPELFGNDAPAAAGQPHLCPGSPCRLVVDPRVNDRRW